MPGSGYYTASIINSTQQKNFYENTLSNHAPKDVPHRQWQLMTTQSNNTGNYTSNMYGAVTQVPSSSARNWTYVSGRGMSGILKRRTELSRAYFEFDLSGWQDVGLGAAQSWTMQSITMSFTFDNLGTEDITVANSGQPLYPGDGESWLTSSFAVNWSPKSDYTSGLVDGDWDNYVTDAGFYIEGDDEGNLLKTQTYYIEVDPEGVETSEQTFMKALGRYIAKDSSSFDVCVRCPFESHRAPEMMGYSQAGGMSYNYNTGSSGASSTYLPPPITSCSGYEIWGVGMNVSESYGVDAWKSGLSPSGSHLMDISSSCVATAGNLGDNRTFGSLIHGSGSGWLIEPKLIIRYNWTSVGGGG